MIDREFEHRAQWHAMVQGARSRPRQPWDGYRSAVYSDGGFEWVLYEGGGTRPIAHGRPRYTVINF